MPSHVKLVLRRTVEDLGKIGDIVTVRAAYARNYLLPQGYAMEVNVPNLARLEKEKVTLLEEEAAQKASLEAVAERAKQVSITITMHANEDGTLYGSVTGRVIADYFQHQGVPIEAKSVVLPDPIKELGVFPVTVNLGQGVQFETKVWIVDESGAVPKEAEATVGAADAGAEESGKQG